MFLMREEMESDDSVSETALDCELDTPGEVVHESVWETGKMALTSEEREEVFGAEDEDGFTEDEDEVGRLSADAVEVEAAAVDVAREMVDDGGCLREHTLELLVACRWWSCAMERALCRERRRLPCSADASANGARENSAMRVSIAASEENMA